MNWGGREGEERGEGGMHHPSKPPNQTTYTPPNSPLPPQTPPTKQGVNDLLSLQLVPSSSSILTHLYFNFTNFLGRFWQGFSMLGPLGMWFFLLEFLHFEPCWEYGR